MVKILVHVDNIINHFAYSLGQMDLNSMSIFVVEFLLKCTFVDSVINFRPIFS